MDNNTKQKLILIVAILAAALVFYYIASPYQNCLRSYERAGITVNSATESICRDEASW